MNTEGNIKRVHTANTTASNNRITAKKQLNSMVDARIFNINLLYTRYLTMSI